MVIEIEANRKKCQDGQVPVNSEYAAMKSKVAY